MDAAEQNLGQAMQAPVRIEKLVHGGLGLGRLADGKVALVEGALPGETVRIRTVQAQRGHVEAVIGELVQAAPERVQPPCPFYAECGGCNLQHASYGAQLGMKAAIVAESLQRAGLSIPKEILAPTLASPQQFGYRYRLRLHLGRGGQLGFHRRRSNDIVAINRCLLATEGINTALARLLAAVPLDALARHVTALELSECPASGRIFLVLHLRDRIDRMDAGTIQQKLRAVLPPLEDVADYVCTAQGQCLLPQGTAKSSLILYQHFTASGLDYALRWPPASFFQVNVRQNEQLVALAMESACSPTSALDLFCGAGNFSIPLALLGAQVLGIEASTISIRWAQKNAQEAGLKNARFISADASRELTRLQREQDRFDTILLDPPRQGLGKAAGLLPGFRARRMVSISCDPATHARDLRLMLAGGYRLIKVQPVDMFPQTHHIETLAVLECDTEPH